MDCEDRTLVVAAVETTFGSNSDMFEAAVGKFVKAVGRESLIPVPNLDQADRCRPYQVVVKKNRRWFWQSPKYETTPYQLNQLLISPEDEFTEVKVAARKLTNYNKTYEFDVNGKTGAKLLSLFDFEIDGSDVISVEAKFGEITKMEVDQPAFSAHIDGRQMDMKHDFIEQVRNDPRKTLCVVVGTAQVAADADIHMKTNRKGEAKEDAGKLPADITNEDVDVSVGDKADNELLIPKGTPVAYNICELLVTLDGEMELMVERNSLGGFDEKDDVDGGYQEGILDGLALEEQFGPILKMSTEDRRDLSSSLLNICSTPADIDPLLKMLKAAQRAARSKVTKSGQLKVRGQMEDCQHILTLAGCQVKDGATVIYPEKATLMLDTLRTIFEALIEMDDATVLALRHCVKEHTPALLYLLGNMLDQQETKKTDEKLAKIYTEGNTALAFIDTLGIVTSESGEVTSSLDNQCEIEGAYRAVYATWWDKSMSAAPASAYRCTIL